ncbi:MAG TPA: hypothetical protein H9829_08160 [Candidatus Tetragenococcus pullicola]|nr:hypothetical protein [Candidatus Tetragenococcus pullicola]
MKQKQEWTSKVKRKGQKGWVSFQDAVYANQKKTLLYVVSGLIIVCLATVLMIKLNDTIRTQQVNNITHNDFSIKKVKPLDYTTADKTIKEKKAVSVMFSKTYGRNYLEVQELLTKKEVELNRTFYYYPIVYNTDDLIKNYQIDPEKITFIFFEEGKEKNRFVYEDLEAPVTSFIPELNRLPMWNIQEESANSEN